MKALGSLALFAASICGVPSGTQANQSNLAQPVTPNPAALAPTTNGAIPTKSALIATIDPKDLQDWRRAELTDTQEAYLAYLSTHPNGWFRAVAIGATEPGIPSTIGERPHKDIASPSPRQRAEIMAWESSVWESAKKIGTNMAARGYLVRVRNGVNREEAVNLYLATRPKTPDGVPVDCVKEELELRVIQRFDFERAFPQRAIDQRIQGTASGTVIVDKTGLVLAYSNPIYSNAEVFEPSVLRQVLRMRYQPLRAGCLVGPPSKEIRLDFKFGN